MEFHKREDEESSVQEDSCGKTFLLMRAHPCANWRSKSNASWSRMTQREKEPEYTCNSFVACTSCSTRKVGTSCMITVIV